MTDEQRDEFHERMEFVLGEIARGRVDNGRPLASEVCRRMARDVLSMFGVEWPVKEKVA